MDKIKKNEPAIEHGVKESFHVLKKVSKGVNKALALHNVHTKKAQAAKQDSQTDSETDSASDSEDEITAPAPQH